MTARQTIFGAIAIALPMLAGCGSDDPLTPDPNPTELLAPPAEGEGYQFSMVTSIEAGNEVEHCKFVKAPAEGMNINRDEVRYTKGSHHFLVYETDYTEIPTEKENGEPVDTSDVFDCTEGPTDGWRVTKLVGGSQNADGTSIVSYPPGVAMKVQPGAVLLMNAHYINATTEPIEPEVRINFYTIPDAEVEIEGDILFWYNPFIKVAAQGEGRARMRCLIEEDITLVNVQSHMHARGVDYAVFEEGQDQDPFYTNTKWENVPVGSFDPGMQFEQGSIVDYYCDYMNPGTEDVYQGARSTDEMCMVIGSYYPADVATSNCFVAEWVGNGTASCADSQLCIQGAFTGGDVLADMTDCIDASDPAVATELSDLVNCIFSSNNPLEECSTEIEACGAT